MYVRTIYATGDPAKLDGAIDGLSTDGRKLPAEQPGCRGMGCSLDLGRIVAIPVAAARG